MSADYDRFAVTSDGHGETNSKPNIFAEIEPTLDTKVFVQMIEQNASFNQWVTQNNVWAKRLERITGGEVTMKPGRNPYYALRAWELASLIPKPDRNGYIPRGTWPNNLRNIEYALSKTQNMRDLMVIELDFLLRSNTRLNTVQVEIYFGSIDSETGEHPYEELVPVIESLWKDYDPRTSETGTTLNFTIPDAQIHAAMRVLFYRLYMTGLKIRPDYGTLFGTSMQLSAKLAKTTTVLSGNSLTNREVYDPLEPVLSTAEFHNLIDSVPEFAEWVRENNVWQRRINRVTDGKLTVARDEDPFYKLRAWELAQPFINEDGVFDTKSALMWRLAFRDVSPAHKTAFVYISIRPSKRRGEGQLWLVSFKWSGNDKDATPMTESRRAALITLLEALGFKFDNPKASRYALATFDAGEELDGKNMEQLIQLFYVLHAASLRYDHLVKERLGEKALKKGAKSWENRLQISAPRNSKTNERSGFDFKINYPVSETDQNRFRRYEKQAAAMSGTDLFLTDWMNENPAFGDWLNRYDIRVRIFQKRSRAFYGLQKYLSTDRPGMGKSLRTGEMVALTTEKRFRMLRAHEITAALANPTGELLGENRKYAAIALRMDARVKDPKDRARLLIEIHMDRYRQDPSVLSAAYLTVRYVGILPSEQVAVIHRLMTMIYKTRGPAFDPPEVMFDATTTTWVIETPTMWKEYTGLMVTLEPLEEDRKQSAAVLKSLWADLEILLYATFMFGYVPADPLYRFEKDEALPDLDMRNLVSVDTARKVPSTKSASKSDLIKYIKATNPNMKNVVFSTWPLSRIVSTIADAPTIPPETIANARNSLLTYLRQVLPESARYNEDTSIKNLAAVLQNELTRTGGRPGFVRTEAELKHSDVADTAFLGYIETFEDV